MLPKQDFRQELGGGSSVIYVCILYNSRLSSSMRRRAVEFLLGHRRQQARTEGSEAVLDDFTLFYAWQSDRDAKVCRYLIRDAAKAAIKKLTTHSTIEDAPRLDHDTLKVAGTPEVASTIFDKINKAGLFLADVSFVGTSHDGDAIPNPNVLLELGYAASRLGWERTILVMNTAYGAPDALIFDLRHRRWPITYHLDAPDAADIKAQKEKLADRFAEAIVSAAQQEHASVDTAIGSLDKHCLCWMHDLGKSDYFQAPDRQTAGDILGSQQLDSALPRLLDLGIIRCDVNSSAGLYAYHWTYFGKLVLYRLGFRQRPNVA